MERIHIRIGTRLKPNTRPACQWMPKYQRHLHYAELYLGVLDCLRRAPDASRKHEVLDYLRELREAPLHFQRDRLQFDRILWTQAWLRELEEDESDSAAETIIITTL